MTDENSSSLTSRVVLACGHVSEAKRAALEEAANCNSGRLVAFDKETRKPIEPELEPSIAVVEEPRRGHSGPVWVRGGIIIKAADWATYEIRNRVALCRCGISSAKPFCDRTHRVMKDGVPSNRLANDPARNIDAKKMLTKPKMMDDERP